MEEKNIDNVKRENNFLKILLFVLLALIIGVSCWFGSKYYYDSLSTEKNSSSEKNDNNSKSDKSDEWKSIGKDITKLGKTYEYVNPFLYNVNRTNSKSFNDKELFMIGLKSLGTNDFIKTSEKDAWGYFYYSLSNEKILNCLDSIFGNNYSLNPSAMIESSFEISADVHIPDGNGMTIISYDDNSKNYKVRFSGIGGTTGPSPVVTTRVLNNVYEKNNQIKVEEKAIYVKTDGFNSKVYGDYQMTGEVLKEFNYTADTANNVIIDVNDFLDKAGTITSIYEKTSNGNYIFISSNLS